MTIDLESLRSEAERLRDEIADMELKVKRLKAIEQVLDAYKSDAPSVKCENVEKHAEDFAEHSESAPLFEGVRPRTAEILTAAWKEIQTRGAPVLTRALVEALAAKGIEIGGKDSVATLSAALSHSEYFENEGRNVGWTIKAGPEIPDPA